MATDVVMIVIDEMFLDSTLLTFDVIGDDISVDTVGDGGNEGVAVFKDNPDNVEDEEKGNDEGWESIDAAAIDAVVAVINGYGDGDEDGIVDRSSAASVCECKILPLKYDEIKIELSTFS